MNWIALPSFGPGEAPRFERIDDPADLQLNVGRPSGEYTVLYSCVTVLTKPCCVDYLTL